MELSSAKQDKLLPKVLLTGSSNAMEIDLRQVDIVELDVAQANEGEKEVGEKVAISVAVLLAMRMAMRF